MKQNSKVLVTGATGFTGLVLTRKLVDAGMKVSAIARPTSDLKPLSDLDIKWYIGDVYDKALTRDAVKEVDFIFHLATTFREAKSFYEDYRNVHIVSTQLLAHRAIKNPNFKRFIHVSSVGVHSHVEVTAADENHSFAPDDDYQRTKADAELWLREFGQKTGLPFTVIRPTAIFGPGDKRLLKLFKMARLKLCPLLGGGECIYHLIHVDDLTNALILAASSKAALDEVFICGNDKPIAVERIIKIVAKTLNHNVRIVRLPIHPFFVAADLCEAVCRPLHLEPIIYRRRVAFYSKDRRFDTSKMRNILKYQPVYSNENGLIQTTKWYLEQGWL